MICTQKVRHIWGAYHTVVPFYVSEPQGFFYAVYDVSPMAIRYENRLHKVEMRGIMSL